MDSLHEASALAPVQHEQHLCEATNIEDAQDHEECLPELDASRESAASSRASEPCGGQHEHSDSLVTVRLSGKSSRLSSQETEGTPDASSEPRESPEAGLAEAEEQALEAGELTEAPRRSELNATSDSEDLTSKSTEKPAGTARSSSSTIDASNASKLDEQSQRSSRSSTAPSLPAPAGDSSNTLEAELEICTSPEKPASLHSQESDSAPLDWAELEKNEEAEKRDEGTDESTAFLLARLEQENNALATDPKSRMSNKRLRSGSRPPSIQQLKRLVSEPTKSTLRYSLLPNPPPMTELEFWSALVRDYPQTAQRLPTLTSNKIRNGIPAPLRGVVWVSIAGARDAGLEEQYDKLGSESSPYEKAIHKDVGRSFPGVDMFRDPEGEGQKMLSRVLNAFSLWDQEIGYCQGLGFVVGPLLMHMGDKEAFCILVRLMEHYDLRSCFLPDLSGLHLRVYQFQHLLKQHLPELTAHLDKLKVEPLYLSQWFLSFFGVTCPLPMLIRIYDVILTEGASETLMRVALSLMRRNEKRVLASSEFEDVMQFLLGRGVWDTYNCSADDLVNDFCTWTGLVTREGLRSLETKFKDKDTQQTTPTLHSAASRFLGRFWTGTASASPKSTSPSLAAPSQPASDIRRTNSKQSMASTLNSVESAESNTSTAATDASLASRQSSADAASIKHGLTSPGSMSVTRAAPNKDKDLHTQIEDLLTALSNMQREHSVLASELQREREEREEDRAVVSKALDRLKKRSLSIIPEDSDEPEATTPNTPLSPALESTIADLEAHFTPTSKRSSLVLQTKHQLRDEAHRWKAQHAEEAARARELARQLTEREAEAAGTREQLRDARARVADAYRDKQRLEKLHREQRQRDSLAVRGGVAGGAGGPDLSVDTATAGASPLASAGGDSGASTPASASGLREFRLGRRSASGTAAGGAGGGGLPAPVFGKRGSSLTAQSVLATEDHRPAPEDALLLELVNAKTAEAVARQELEEVKGRLDALRKLVGGSPGPLGGGGGGGGATSPGVEHARRQTPPSPGPKAAAPKEKEKDKATPPAVAPASGGFFSGWGKRAVSGTGS